MSLNWLRKFICPWLCETSPIPKPKVTWWISSQHMLKELREVFPYGGTIYLSDQKYGLPTLDEIEMFLDRNRVDIRKYIPVLHDCDDFSYELMGDASDWCSYLAFFRLEVVWEEVGGEVNRTILEAKEFMELEAIAEALHEIDKIRHIATKEGHKVTKEDLIAGIMKGHALNFCAVFNVETRVVDKWCIEPQNDKIFAKPEKWRLRMMSG